jgi:hypothetical protein
MVLVATISNSSFDPPQSQFAKQWPITEVAVDELLTTRCPETVANGTAGLPLKNLWTHTPHAERALAGEKSQPIEHPRFVELLEELRASGAGEPLSDYRFYLVREVS